MQLTEAKGSEHTYVNEWTCGHVWTLYKHVEFSTWPGEKKCEFFRSLVALIFHHVISGNQVNILIGMHSLKFQQQQVKQS